tara:strand:+ start:367 stop:615 length:249 start_codon:yes stop_codon:yes gene_type:complete
VWIGELDNSKYHVIIGCYKKIIKIKIGETEFDTQYNSEILDVGKINKIYDGLSFLTYPPNNCEIKLVLELLDWKYDDDDIWC